MPTSSWLGAVGLLSSSPHPTHNSTANTGANSFMARPPTGRVVSGREGIIGYTPYQNQLGFRLNSTLFDNKEWPSTFAKISANNVWSIATAAWRRRRCLGIWTAVAEIWPHTAEQRCWNHRILNVLNKRPKSVQAEARRLLTQIPYAPTRQEAKKRRDQFAKRFRGQYPDAARRCSSAMGTAW